MLEIRGLGHTFGHGPNAHTALDGIDLTVRAGELVCIVGPSGAGKSTLLRAVAGLLRPSHGQVLLAGKPIEGRVPPDLALVFQDYRSSLFPWLSVRGNVEFPLSGRGLSRRGRRRAALAALAAVGLADAAKRRPWQLSGGMQQRVAIARALAYRPKLLLMDEPFASVDAQTRADLEDLVLTVRRSQDVTILFVTHDIDESVYLGDRVVVLSRPPTTVAADLATLLPAERDQIATRQLERFVRLRAEVGQLIRHGGSGALAARDAES